MIHNHPILSLLVLTLAVTFLVSCEKAPKDTTAEDSRAIKAASKQYIDNFNSGNSAAVAALYAEEAKILPPNSPMIVGREGIQAFYQGGFDAGVVDARITMTVLNVLGDEAYQIGTYTNRILPEEGEAIVDSGKYVTILKRVNGSWKINVGIFNTNLPLPVPEEE